MTSSDSAFAGSIPAVYELKLGPMLFEPYAAEIAGRLTDLREGALLETAAGTGIVTSALARTLPETVTITATDLNEAMLAVARDKPGAERVVWRVADAVSLPFGDAGFDAVVCGFGVMFFPDRDAAYAEAARVLRPGGRILLTSWDPLEHNDVPRVVQEAAVRADHPPDILSCVPFGYWDRDTLRAQLHRAGFSAVVIDSVALPCRAESAGGAAAGICQGTPLRMQIEARGGSLEEVTSAAATALEAQFGAGPIEARMQALLVSGIR